MYIPHKLDPRVMRHYFERNLEEEVKALEFVDECFAGGVKYPTRHLAKKAVRLMVDAFNLGTENALFETFHPHDLPYTRITRLRAAYWHKEAIMEAIHQEAHVPRRHWGDHGQPVSMLTDDEIFRMLKRRMDKRTITTLQGALEYLATAIHDRLGMPPIVEPPITTLSLADGIADIAETLEGKGDGKPVIQEPEPGEMDRVLEVVKQSAKSAGAERKARKSGGVMQDREPVFWLLPDGVACN